MSFRGDPEGIDVGISTNENTVAPNGRRLPRPYGPRNDSGDRWLVLLVQQLDKLEFGGQCPLTMRARLVCNRYFPDPLGIVTAERFDKLEFGGQCPQAIRARCIAFRYCPNPLGIVTAERFDKLELA